MGWLIDGSPVADNGFTHKGIQYPPGWIQNASETSRQAAGITVSADPKAYDERFSFGWNDGETEQIWKDISTLKTLWKANQDSYAGKILSKSDWRVIKAKELGGTVPNTWKTYRSAVRTAANTRQGEIDAASTSSALQTIIKNNSLTAWPDEPTS